MEKILIIDFGSQYTQLIARKIRELNVYCEIYPYNNFPEITSDIKGVVLSGSPFSVRDDNAPDIDFEKIKMGELPVLGICFGAQLITQKRGGTVEPSKFREYGRAKLIISDNKDSIFSGINNYSQVWMSHADSIVKLANGAKVIAKTESIPVAVFKIDNGYTYGLQFHPEVFHSEEGQKILKNFVVDICGVRQDWTPQSFVESTVKDLKEQLGNDKVVLGLSGGVDSSVAAVLLHKAIGKNLYCIFVDTGLLRKNEFEEVLHSYKDMGLNVVGVDVSEQFLSKLEGVKEPEEKRKIIGATFIEVFEKEAKKIENVKWLAQGTIYPDIIESISVSGPSVTIKSHHNVGGLPEKMNLKVVEPLRLLFKDEVRRVGRAINVPDNILMRHPFPGPGLAIRIIGEITRERVKLLQEADYIFITALKEFRLYNDVWQAATILLPIKSVGVMGDERTYENVVALRAVNSTDGMTADWSRLPYDFLAEVSNRIINRVKGINRVVYDISSKPPATIEWE